MKKILNSLVENLVHDTDSFKELLARNASLKEENDRLRTAVPSQTASSVPSKTQITEDDYKVKSHAPIKHSYASLLKNLFQ